MRPTTLIRVASPVVLALCAIPSSLVWLSLVVLTVDVTVANTVRYRQGRIDDIDDSTVLSVHNDTSVATARRHCQADDRCVSFGFESPFTRFPPGDTISAYFHSHADWHVSRATGRPVFTEDLAWHLYVNTTRERVAVRSEVDFVLDRIDSLVPLVVVPTTIATKSRLRKGPSATVNNDEETVMLLLSSLYFITYPREIKVIAAAAPKLILTMLEIGCSNDDQQAVSEEIRLMALTVVLVIADSKETVPMLLAAGVYEKLTKLITDQVTTTNNNEWGTLPTMALDILSNMALHRTGNDPLRRRGAQKFFQQIVIQNGTGFPALQAALALTHTVEDEGIKFDDGNDHANDIVIADRLIEEMVTLMQSSIDGDVVYDIVWDLIPGPLSAIRFLVRHHSNISNNGKRQRVVDTLLDAGLMEQLMRVLEADCLVASHVEAALDILDGLASVSYRAREMISLAADSVYHVRRRLATYEAPAALARDLAEVLSDRDFVGSHDVLRSEL